MYSKEETQHLKREFWIAFSERYPRKWILYDTKIKDFSFKFYADNKKAQVLIAIENRNEEKRTAYFDNINTLKNVLSKDFDLDLVYEKKYFLENGKEISQIWIEKLNISLSDKKKWNEIFDFFNQKMSSLELFYHQYDEIIKNI